MGVDVVAPSISTEAGPITAGGDVTADSGLATQVVIGANGLGVASMALGSAADTTMRRTAAGVLQADQQFNVGTFFRHLGTQLGFFGAALVARAAAYVLTYATKSRTLANDTAVNVAATASTNVTPFGYTTAAQADAIPVNINAIRVDLDNAKNVLAQVVADLQNYGLLQ